MKRNYISRVLVSGLLLIAAAVQGQQAKSTASTKHSLWKVEGKGGVVYLVGSVHVLKEQNYPLPAPIEQAFTNARIAVFETDIEGLENPEMVMKLALSGRLPEGETLKDQLSPAVYASFSDYVKKAGLPLEIFDQFKPSMAALSLVAIEIKKLGLNPEYGLDKYFHKQAKAAGKKIVPLETVDFQLGLFTNFSKSEGESLLRSTLKDIETIQNRLGELVQAWQTGNSVELEKLLNEAKEEEPAIYKRLVTDRNRNWLPKIEELAKGKEPAVVIVGAGHLVGTNGIVELLKQKGYRISQQ